MQILDSPGARTVAAARYLLHLRDGAAGAVLADPSGRAWTRLSLLASVDRVEVPDESYDLGQVSLDRLRVGGEDAVELSLSTASTAWDARTVRLRCFEDRLELTAHVQGHGVLGEVQLLGGRAVLGSGACGSFASSIEFASLFDPAPTEPIQVVRPATAAATLGVVGDAHPGRLHGLFSPPPLCLVFGREAGTHPTRVPEGDWLSVGVVAAVPELRFTELRYRPEDGGFRLELDYDGHTAVDGAFSTPTLVLRPATDPWQALADHRDDLVGRGLAPAGPVTPPARWWSEPLFCGWGAQCAQAAVRSGVRDVAGPAADLARQDHYDRWLDRLAAHGVVPGTVVVDDRWQTTYGGNDPDADRWPDLRAWIARRHAAGQRVLLWWKAWDPEGLPVEECVLTPAGRPVAVDPGSPAYAERVAGIVATLLGPDGLDADGFKVDFTQRSPAGRSLVRPSAAADAPWGIAGLHALLGLLYRAAKAAKPDALLITHTPHPGFGDVTDMVRLNDILVHAVDGSVVPAADQLAFRHGVAAASLPDHLIDTDQWPIADRGAWRGYVRDQVRRGVPSLYYAEHLHYTEYLHFAERIDHVGDELTADDLALVASAWRDYRAGRTVPT